VLHGSIGEGKTFTALTIIEEAKKMDLILKVL